MSGPFKMKGHSLPGPNQAAPAKQKDTHPEKRKTTTKTQKTFKETETERIKGEKYTKPNTSSIPKLPAHHL